MSSRPQIDDLTLANRGDQKEEPTEEVVRQKKVNAIRIPVVDVIPDHSQPRPILPGDIKRRMFSEGKTCFWAAEKWRLQSSLNPSVKKRYESLLNLGETIIEYGQIKPITGSWFEFNGNRKFLIESGERRFWSVVLNAMLSDDQATTIQAMVIDQPSAERQVIENRHAEAPTAVAKACEIAKLILSEQNIAPTSPGKVDENYDPFSYFKKVLDIKKIPDGVWEKISPVMGNLGQRHMGRHLSILNFPSNILELVDQAELPERKLRDILKLPETKWSAAVVKEIKSLNDDVPKPAKKKTKTAPASLQAAKKANAFIEFAAKAKLNNKIDKVAESIIAELNSAEDVQTTAETFESLAKSLRRLASKKKE